MHLTSFVIGHWSFGLPPFASYSLHRWINLAKWYETMSTHTEHTRDKLIALSHALGRAERQLAILGEGNTSARLEGSTFLVKASGSTLGTLNETHLVECRSEPLLALLDREDLSDQQIEDALFDCRVNPDAKKPSIESLFHAYLLSLPGVGYVGHTHPVSINGILCTPHAAAFARRRMCPDEVVCCGAAFVLVPYVDPGVALAQAIRRKVARFMEKRGVPPGTSGQNAPVAPDGSRRLLRQL